MYVHVNGRVLRSQDAVISVFDHGFLYGDGIYETLRVYDGVVFKLDEHLKRLFRSAALIGLTIPLGIDHLKIAVYEVLMANALREAYVRLTISRGNGPIGLDPDLCPEPTVVIIAQKFRAYPLEYFQNGLHLIIPRTRRNDRKAINPQIKSLNFLNNILAKIEAKKAKAHEAVMLNLHGHLTEGTISNIFFFNDRKLCTPSPDCGILEGITRNMIIDIAQGEGMTVQEARFGKSDIYAAQEVFITNTTMEVMPVSRIDDRRFPVGNITKLLRTIYQQEVNAYIADIKSTGPSLWAQHS
jgi:branched-chain amino acid aminotransferase